MEVDKAERGATRERRSVRKSDQPTGSAASEPRRGPKSCSSHYKGVTKHRRTGRWEAHIWGRALNKGPGKQIYLGGFVTPEEAAEAHDLAALQLQGPTAKTNFHISKYTEWLATLQATPSEDNLPLQLRRAGMFKRCTDRARLPPDIPQIPGPGIFLQPAAIQQPVLQQPEPITPMTAEAKAQLSRASDSSAEALPAANMQTFDESVTSQSDASGAVRRPLAVRFGMAVPAEGQAGTVNMLAQHGIAHTSVSLPQGATYRNPAQAASAEAHLVLPGRSMPAAPNADFVMPQGQYLHSRVVQQLAPLGWRSFQALAEEQAVNVAVHPEAPGVRPAQNGEAAAQAAVSSAQAVQFLQQPFYQYAPPEGTSFMNSSANGGIVYGHKQFLGFLSPEQVQWLEASGVKFPEHLQLQQFRRDGPHQQAPAILPQPFGSPAVPVSGVSVTETSSMPQPSTSTVPPLLSAAAPQTSTAPLQQANAPTLVPPALSEPESAPVAVRAQPNADAEEERNAPQAQALDESAPMEGLTTAQDPAPPQEGVMEASGEQSGGETGERPIVAVLVAAGGEPTPMMPIMAPREEAANETSSKQNEQPAQPPADAAASDVPKKKRTGHEDQQIAEALLGLKAANK